MLNPLGFFFILTANRLNAHHTRRCDDEEKEKMRRICTDNKARKQLHAISVHIQSLGIESVSLRKLRTATTLFGVQPSLVTLILWSAVSLPHDHGIITAAFFAFSLSLPLSLSPPLCVHLPNAAAVWPSHSPCSNRTRMFCNKLMRKNEFPR